jgi:hypothetical protein
VYLRADPELVVYLYGTYNFLIIILKIELIVESVQLRIERA